MMILKLAFHFLAVRRLRLAAITVAFLSLTFCFSRPPGTLLLIAFAFAALIAYQFRGTYLDITNRNDYLRMLPAPCRTLYLSQLSAALAVGCAGLVAYWAAAGTGVLEPLSTQIIADHRYELFFLTDVAWVVLTTLVVYVSVIHLGYARTVSGWVSAPALIIALRQLVLPQTAEWAIPVAIAVCCAFALGSSGKPATRRLPALAVGALICLPGVVAVFFFLAGTLNGIVGAIFPVPDGWSWVPLGVYLAGGAWVVYTDSVRRGSSKLTAAGWGLGALLLIGYPLIEIAYRVSAPAFGKCRRCRRLRLHQLAACPFCGETNEPLPIDLRRRLRLGLIAGLAVFFALRMTQELTGSVPLLCRLSSEQTVLQRRLNGIHLTVFSSPFFEIDADQVAERHSWNRVTLRAPQLSELDTPPEAFLENPYDSLCSGNDVKATFHVRGLVSGRVWSGPLKVSGRYRTWSRGFDSLSGKQTSITVEMDIPDVDEERQLFRDALAQRPTLEDKLAYLCTLGPPAPYLVAISLTDKPREAETLLEKYFEQEYRIGNLSEFRAYQFAREILSRGKLPQPIHSTDTVQLGLTISSKDANSSIRIDSVRADNSPLSGCRYSAVNPGPVASLVKCLLNHGRETAVERAFRRSVLLMSREPRMEVLEQLTAATPPRAALFTHPQFQTVYSARAIGRNADPRVLALLQRTYERHLRRYRKVMAVFAEAEAKPGVVRNVSYSYGPLHFLAAALLATEKPEYITLAAQSFPLELAKAAETEDSKPLELDLLDVLNRCSEETIRLFLYEVPNADWSRLNLENYHHIKQVVKSLSS